MADKQSHSGKAAWDEEFAESLRGTSVLIGITYLNADGSLDEQIQMHGRVAIVDAQRGIAIALEGKRAGQTYWLPPALTGFNPAQPGEYRLRSTGEVVTDPEFISNWTINRPAKT